MLAQMLAVINGLSMVQKIVGGFLLVLVMGTLLSLTLGGPKVNYNVLFSNLTQEDAGEVVAKLKELRIAYQLSENGKAILVPSDKVHEVRLTLAGDGLPRGGGVGFEIFDKTSFGTTDFVHRLNYQRALQGELARTIRNFQQIEEARVHLATPKESVFIEDQKPPSASISVKLRGREKLTEQQIQSIVNLVACAVPGLVPENITVVDTTGRLLYRKEGGESAMLSATQLEHQSRLEETLRKKVENILEEVVGVERVKAQVTAEMNFSKVDMTQESFDPETQVVRSEQLLAEGAGAGLGAQGIPGVKGNLATFANTPATNAAGESGQTGGINRNNVVRNYEISKTTKHVQEAVGTVKRLSVAVMVDGTYDKSRDGAGQPVLKYKARTPEEMQRFENLVKKAIGYSEEREDQVEVANMSFALSAIPEPEDKPMDKWLELLERFSMPIIYLFAALMFLLLVLRPLLRILSGRLVVGQKSPHEGAGAGQSVLSGVQVAATPEEEDLVFQKSMTDKERIYRLAQSDPERAADLVRRWLREEV
ncbi:MAG: flagellar M-ring protein FliF [Deltaproteobacteria bacterium RIFOXYD12_FULL_50_9]|nr:MAG: flagellar M-ring protein FliF [Deltaproteobacteria bacterium RIFOXYD12_FULL_50_9]